MKSPQILFAVAFVCAGLFGTRVTAQGPSRDNPDSSFDWPPASAINVVNVNQTVTISGDCADENDKPLPDVKVMLFRRTIRLGFRLVTIGETRSGTNGEYRFPDVPIPPPEEEVHSVYICVLTAQGRASQQVHVESFSKMLHRKVRMQPSATMSGRVTDSDGKPIAGVWVWTQGLGSSEGPQEGVMSARTDADGRYAISDLVPLEVETEPRVRIGKTTTIRLASRIIRVRHPQYVQKVGTYTKAPGTVDFSLEEGGAIEGLVIDCVTGKPASDVAVIVRTIDRETGDNLRESRTDALGKYKITGVNPARYVIWAKAEDRTCVALNDVSVVARQTCEAPDLQLISGSLIMGRVFGPGTQAITHDAQTGIRLWIGFHGPSHPKHVPGIEWVGVDDNGRFRIRVAAGTNYLSILSNGGELWKRTQRHEEYDKGLEIEPGETRQVFFRVLPK